MQKIISQRHPRSRQRISLEPAEDIQGVRPENPTDCPGLPIRGFIYNMAVVQPFNKGCFFRFFTWLSVPLLPLSI